uniref:Uncharacterized protein n=1 Tax=Strongyloides papillosus TaxID=174720 RepID=A0A0N5CIU1_STREA
MWLTCDNIGLLPASNPSQVTLTPTGATDHDSDAVRELYAFPVNIPRDAVLLFPSQYSAFTCADTRRSRQPLHSYIEVLDTLPSLWQLHSMVRFDGHLPTTSILWGRFFRSSTGGQLKMPIMGSNTHGKPFLSLALQ